jgi:hypothetical protein
MYTNCTVLSRLWIACFLIFFSTLPLLAQDTLPKFSVKDIGKDRYVISWVNNFTYTAQITIQRSFDSARGYKSILTVPDPSAKQNGFADTKAQNDHMFYRLYILLDNGNYLFTAAKQPIKDSSNDLVEAPKPASPPPITTSKNDVAPSNASLPAETKPSPTLSPRSPITSTTKPIITETPTKKPVETTQNTAPAEAAPIVIEVKRIEPTIVKIAPTRAGDSAKIPTAVAIKDEPTAFAPSLYIYSHPDGNIRIQVPNKARLARYRIKFYEPPHRLLFELKNLPAPSFQLDKTNFLHGGWFPFELFEDNRLIEQHKVYIERQ